MTLYGRTTLEIDATMPFDEWLGLCRSLGVMAVGHQWWIGETLIYGEDQYGEEFAQGEAEMGIPPQTASNYRWVASRVAVSRRREDLSWSHHAEVARLKSKQQTAALAAAARDGWNVRQLRDHVALTYPPETQPRLFDDEPDPGPLSDREHADVQRRIERITLALEAGDDIDRDDIAWLVATVRRLTRSGR